MNVKHKEQPGNNFKRRQNFKKGHSQRIMFGDNNTVPDNAEGKRKKGFFNKTHNKGLAKNSVYTDCNENTSPEKKSVKGMKSSGKFGGSLGSFVEKLGSMPKKGRWKRKNILEKTNATDVALSLDENEDDSSSKVQSPKKGKARSASHLDANESKIAEGFSIEVEDELEHSMKSERAAANEIFASRNDSTVVSIKKKKNKNKYRVNQDAPEEELPGNEHPSDNFRSSASENERKKDKSEEDGNTFSKLSNLVKKKKTMEGSFEQDHTCEQSNSSIVSKKKKKNKNKYRMNQDASEEKLPSNEHLADNFKSSVSENERRKDKTEEDGNTFSESCNLVKKRKTMEDSFEQDNTGKQSKRKKITNPPPSVPKPTKLSKQSKKLRKELPGLEEPELIKYRINPSLEMLDDITEEESSDENFGDSSDDSCEEKNGDSLLETLKRDSPEKLERTVFVGNLPLAMTLQVFKKTFSQCGKIETVRFRSSVPTKSSVPKKVANIKHEYGSLATSLKGYIVFAELESAKKALKLNGTVVDGHHIRVDRAIGAFAENHELCVFVGNLPFNIDDESLWKSFLEVGPVKSIRVVRDRETGAGKGFGFVQFKDPESVELAVSCSENLELGGRKIRIKKSEYTLKQREKKSDANHPQRKYWKPIGKELDENPAGRNKSRKKFNFKKQQKEWENKGSRKTAKKLLNKRRRDQHKKKISSLFEK